MMGNRLAAHLKRFLLVYSLLAIALGWWGGVSYAPWVATHKGTLRTLAQVLVFLMIYPMMINLNLELLPRVAREPKPVLLSLAYNYLVTPLLAYLLARVFIGNPQLALGFFLVMLIPGSSMAVGYTGLAGGSLEVATVAQALNFLLLPLLLPLFLTALARNYHLAIPTASLLLTVLWVLILPMFLGDLTRRGVLRVYGERGFARLKPWLGSLTMLTMLVLVALIFLLKGAMLAAKWPLLVPLVAASLIYLALILGLATWLDRLLGLNYGEHMGTAFVSSGKNNGTAIAIAVTALSPLVALPAAVLPLIQIVALIGYLHMGSLIMGYFGKRAVT